ncbi:MAG: hypothetical protein FWG44_06170 [Oscillospiraceae bacterium]|nr:hypothetical protein [Oscillospiraceae bacterium]
MRRIVFIFLIIAVVAVVGAYAMLELRVSEIVFVRDFPVTWADGREMVVRRLYNSGVDIDAYIADKEQRLINPDMFTDEAWEAAALASGNPEFYPAFYFSLFNPDFEKDEFTFSAMIKQEFAPEQTVFNFKTANLHVEIITDGPAISDIVFKPENPNEKMPVSPVISEDKRSMAVDLVNVSSYSLTFTGTGRVTFQYTYDIATSNLITNTALEGQLLIVHANISRGLNGAFEVEYICEPYSNLEDYGY